MVTGLEGGATVVSLNETYLKQWQDENLEHLRYEFPDIKPKEIVLDIGSYQKEWGNEMIKRYDVYVESFDALDNKAAWTRNGKLAFGGAYYYTSQYEEKKTVEYWCVDIAPYLAQETAVVKINIEGAEYTLLDYIMNKGLLKNIRHLQVQFHLIDGQNCEDLYRTLADRVEQTHNLIFNYPFVWAYWKRRSDITYGRSEDEVTFG